MLRKAQMNQNSSKKMVKEKDKVPCTTSLSTNCKCFLKYMKTTAALRRTSQTYRKHEKTGLWQCS